jgi:uncharacterized protein (TIGR02117 family)
MIVCKHGRIGFNASPMACMTFRCLSLLLVLVAVAGCSSAVPSCTSTAAGDVVYIVDQGWHAEIGIPVQELGGDLAFYRKIFAGAHVIMFGYGKKTFFTAPPDTISEYFLGPFPGTAVIHVVGLTVTPVDAYPPGSTVTLMLPPGGARALSNFIWQDLSKDKMGNPEEVARSSEPDGLFYAAQSEYNLLHTCNTWTANALHDAGLDLSSDGVIFSGQVMTQINAVAESQCALIR